MHAAAAEQGDGISVTCRADINGETAPLRPKPAINTVIRSKYERSICYPGANIVFRKVCRDDYAATD